MSLRAYLGGLKLLTGVLESEAGGGCEIAPRICLDVDLIDQNRSFVISLGPRRTFSGRATSSKGGGTHPANKVISDDFPLPFEPTIALPGSC